MTAAHKPDARLRRAVLHMTGHGIPQQAIANTIGITEKTLRKYYRDEIDTGVPRANNAVAANLYAIATDRDGGGPTVTAAIFWLKTRAHWRDTGPGEPEKAPKIFISYGAAEPVGEIIVTRSDT